MKIWPRIVSISCILLILLVGLMPGVLAEDYLDYDEEYVTVEFDPGSEGDLTSNFGNLSSVPKNSDPWDQNFPSGAYVGSYEEECLFEIDYACRPFDPDSPATSETGWWFMNNVNVYFCVESTISFTAQQIISGSNHFWVRVPVPVSGFGDGIRDGSQISALAFLQVVNLDNGNKTFFMPPEDPNWGASYNILYNATDIDDRLYIELYMPIIPNNEYLFQFFVPLQGPPPDYDGDDRETNVKKPKLYFATEDVFQSGTQSTLSAGVLKYDTDTTQFYLDTDYPAYGGFEYDLALDAGWSFMFIEGMGNDLFGVKIRVENGSQLHFHPTITPSEDDAYVSLYLPFICDETVSYNVTFKRLTGEYHLIGLLPDTTPGQWKLVNGSNATVDTYWSSDEDCDGDGYIDYPNLNATNFFAVSSRTKIKPYSYLESSLWTVIITFKSTYDITLLCQNDFTIKYIGDTTTSHLTWFWELFQWYSGKTWGGNYVYNSEIFHYGFLSDQQFTEWWVDGQGENVYTYPHFYRYAVIHHYGSKSIWVEVNETEYEHWRNQVDLWNSSGAPDQGNILDQMTNAVQDFASGAWGAITKMGGFIYDGFNWLHEQLIAIGEWIYRGVMSFYENLKIVVEVIVNVLSIAIEFIIILVTLLVFFGAIILYNKFLMIVRDALFSMFNGMNKTYMMGGGA